MKHKSILIAIDIGNTSIHLGLFQGTRLIRQIIIPTQVSRFELKEKINQLASGIKKRRLIVSGIVICSVVPHLDVFLIKLFRTVFGIKAWVAGKDFIVPIKNLYRNPKSVGQDRLVNAFAGLAIYGKRLIIIDAGTAITFDIVSKRGEYLGGIIAPGIRMNLNALAKGTALLPKLQLPKANKKFKLIGKSTDESIYSGVALGASAMIKGLVKELKNCLGKGTKVVLTGGDAKIIQSFLGKTIDVVDPTLTLKGISMLVSNSPVQS